MSVDPRRLIVFVRVISRTVQSISRLIYRKRAVENGILFFFEKISSAELGIIRSVLWIRNRIFVSYSITDSYIRNSGGSTNALLLISESRTLFYGVRISIRPLSTFSFFEYRDFVKCLDNDCFSRVTAMDSARRERTNTSEIRVTARIVFTSSHARSRRELIS